MLFGEHTTPILPSELGFSRLVREGRRVMIDRLLQPPHHPFRSPSRVHRISYDSGQRTVVSYYRCFEEILLP